MALIWLLTVILCPPVFNYHTILHKELCTSTMSIKNKIQINAKVKHLAALFIKAQVGADMSVYRIRSVGLCRQAKPSPGPLRHVGSAASLNALVSFCSLTRVLLFVNVCPEVQATARPSCL